MSFLHSEPNASHSKLSFVIHRQFWQQLSSPDAPWVAAQGLRYPEEQSWSPQPTPRSRRSKASRLPSGRHRTLPERLVALLEVLICSDFPTQIALGATFAALGLCRSADGSLTQIQYVALLLVADTRSAHRADAAVPRPTASARATCSSAAGPWRRGAGRHAADVRRARASPSSVLAALSQLAPWLHTVEHNP